MQVQMFRHPGARRRANIPADVKTLRLNDFFEQPLGIARQVKQLDLLAIRQLRKSRHHPIGNRHQMTCRVGINIHHQESQLPPADDKMFGIISSLTSFAQKLGPFFALIIFDPPRGPQSFKPGVQLAHRKESYHRGAKSTKD